MFQHVLGTVNLDTKVGFFLEDGHGIVIRRNVDVGIECQLIKVTCSSMSKGSELVGGEKHFQKSGRYDSSPERGHGEIK